MAAGLGAWFGYPTVAGIIFIGSIMGALWGMGKQYRMGILKKRFTAFFRGLYLKLAYGTKEIMGLPKLPKEGIPEDSIPYGTFLVIAAWILFLKEVLYCLT